MCACVVGIYTYTYEAERKEDCLACSQVPKVISVSAKDTLRDLIAVLCDSPGLQMKSPGLTMCADNGRNKTLYMSTVASIEEKTRENLNKTLQELGLREGSELTVADVTTPNSLIVKLHFLPPADVDM